MHISTFISLLYGLVIFSTDAYGLQTIQVGGLELNETTRVDPTLADNDTYRVMCYVMRK